MGIVDLPEIPESERTPLVVRLLEIIQQQQELIQMLRDEIAILKGLKPRPKISPSALERQARPPDQEGESSGRPGSQKRAKTAQLTIHREVDIPLENIPPGSTFKGYEDFVVQELILRVENTCYHRERWLSADGRSLVADLPDDVLPGSHYGPNLICYIVHQYHHQHVTQPLLLEQLQQLGIAISAGHLNGILTEKKDGFHQEKEELLPTALRVSSYVEVDDTGARHQGHNGYCTHIGNDLFSYFESTTTKSRLNFLDILRRPYTDYVLNETTLAYWRQQQKLSAAVVAALTSGPSQFADAATWQTHLVEVGVTAERHVRLATEGALLGSVVAHGVSPDLVVLSDGAGQFEVLVHAMCWIHQERALARMIPFSEAHRLAIEGVRKQIWELYQDLKAYRAEPQPSRQADLEARFDALCAERTGFATVNGVLKDMAKHKEQLLCVLQRPEVPLHTNGSESALRDYVKKRKISGSTRSESGRRCRDTFATLKKTCRKLGVNFWDYLQDRIRGKGLIPRLAALVQHKAALACGGGLPAAPA
jgi:Transposase IS66 family